MKLALINHIFNYLNHCSKLVFLALLVTCSITSCTGCATLCKPKSLKTVIRSFKTTILEGFAFPAAFLVSFSAFSLLSLQLRPDFAAAFLVFSASFSCSAKAFFFVQLQLVLSWNSSHPFPFEVRH